MFLAVTPSTLLNIKLHHDMFLFSPLTLTAHVLIGFEEISPHLSGKPKAYVAAAKQVGSLT